MSKYLCTACAVALENDDMSIWEALACPAPYPEQFMQAFNERYGNVVIDIGGTDTGKWEKCESCKYAVRTVHAFEQVPA